MPFPCLKWPHYLRENHADLPSTPKQTANDEEGKSHPKPHHSKKANLYYGEQPTKAISHLSLFFEHVCAKDDIILVPG